MTNTQNQAEHLFDVAVIGGGAAGLAAAVALGRSLRSVIVIDAGEQRNLPAAAAHNVLGREGVAPADLVAAGRAEAAGYGVELVDAAVVAAGRSADRFRLALGSGRSVDARRVLLATGLVDLLPDIPGLVDGWGETVLHCPYCHGWEVRGRRIGVIATGPAAEHQALLMSRLSETVTVFDHAGVVGAAERRRLAAAGVDVVDGAVDRVSTDGRAVRSVRVDSREHPVDAVVVGTRMQARAEVFQVLGGTVDEHPLGTVVAADAMGRTAVDGVWAAGNVCDPTAMVGTAAAAGLRAGVALNAALIEADLAGS